MPVGTHLAVGIEVVEQGEPARERVRIRSDATGGTAHAVVVDDLQARITVTPRIGAEDLVVGAVLSHDIEHVRDLLARAAVPADDRSVVGRWVEVLRMHLVVRDLGQVPHLTLVRRREHTDIAVELVDDVAAVRRSPAVRPVLAVGRVGAGAEALRGQPHEVCTIGGGRDRGRIGGCRDPAGEGERVGVASMPQTSLPRLERDHGDGIFAAVCNVKRATVRRLGESQRRGADAFLAPDRHSPRHFARRGIERDDRVAVRHRHIHGISSGVGEQCFRMRFQITTSTTDADGSDHGSCREVDHAHRAVELIAHIGRVSVSLDCDVVRKSADREELHRMRRLCQVDDGELVGLVQREQQRAAVRCDGEALGPAEATALLLRGAARRRRELDRRAFDASTGRRVDTEHVHRVSCIGNGRAVRHRAASRFARDIRGVTAGTEGDASVCARQRQHLHDRAGRDVDDMHAVLAVARIDGPVEVAVGCQRATGREVTDLGEPARGAQPAAVGRQQQGRPDLPAAHVRSVRRRCSGTCGGAEHRRRQRDHRHENKRNGYRPSHVTPSVRRRLLVGTVMAS